MPQSWLQAILMAAILSTAMGQFIVFAVLAPLIRSVGLAEYQGGLILSCSALIFALSSGVWGRLSSVLGRRRVMLIGLWGYCTGTLLFTTTFALGLSGWIQGGLLFTLLVVSRMFQSILMGATAPATMAYMADITEQEQRVRGMGLLGSANSLGSILGPALAAPLLLLHLLAPLTAAALMAALTALLVWFGIPKPVAAQKPGETIDILAQIRHTLRSYFDPRYSGLLLIGVLMFVAYAMSQQTLGYLIQDRLQTTPQAAATILAHAFIGSAIAALTAQMAIVSWLKLSAFTLLLMGLPCMTIGYGTLIFLHQEWQAIVSFIGVGFGLGLAIPGFSASASLAVSASEQGSVAGVIAGAPALGFILGPTLGALLYQFHDATPYLASAALCLLLMIMVLRLFRLTLKA